MTREEAQKELDSILEKDNVLRHRRECFCPDINQVCRIDCILFIATTGEICYKHGDRENGWEVNIHNGYCRRHMK